MINFFIDGACKKNPGPGGYGVVLHHSDGWVSEFGGYISETTNNRMEITASLEALKIYKEYRNETCKILTDSQHLIQSATQYLKRWSQNGYTTALGEPVKNTDLWQELARCVSFFENKIEWLYVPGHKGVMGNERADEIAQSFALQQRIDLRLKQPIDEYSWDLNWEMQLREQFKAPKYLAKLDQGYVTFETWPECQAATQGLKQARFQKVFGPSQIEYLKKKWGPPKTSA